MPYPRFRINLPLTELAFSVFDVFRQEEAAAVAEFADEFRRYGGYSRVVPAGSGRSAFRLLLESLDFPPGSEIIFPAYTFHPMPVVAAECGLQPVFADVDPKTWTLDPQAFLSRVSPRTKAVVPTHLFGVPAEMDRITAIAREHGLLVVEDCAHALGARYRGKPVGNFGAAALFTFAMSKALPAWGGGAVAVKDGDLASRMRDMTPADRAPSGGSVLREQFSNILALVFTQPAVFPWTLYPLIRIASARGNDFFDRPFLEDVVPPSPASGEQSAVSGEQLEANGSRLGESNKQLPLTAHRSPLKANRLPLTAHRSLIAPLAPFQARVALRQLRRLPDYVARQQRNARLLRAKLAGVSGFELQQGPPEGSSSFLNFRVWVEDPCRSRKALLSVGIDTKPDDMRNCAALGIFADNPPCPNAEHLSGHCIEIPCSPFYSEKQLEEIAGRVAGAWGDREP